MDNSVLEKPNQIMKLPFKEILTENLETGLSSSRAKQQLHRLSPLFQVSERSGAARKRKVEEFAEIGAWTQAELPKISKRARQTNSSLCQVNSSTGKVTPTIKLAKRAVTSCWTECDVDLNKTSSRKQMTMTKISVGTQDNSSVHSFGSNPRLYIVPDSPRKFKPFKSNIILSMMKRRKYTCSNIPIKPKQRKVSQKFEVSQLFQQNSQSKSRLLEFVKVINRLRSKERTKLSPVMDQAL